MTNEEIKKILDGAPEGATHCFDYGDYFKHGDPFALVWDGNDSWFASAMCKKDITHNLTDLRRILEQDATILELRQEVERERDELAAHVELIDKTLYQHGKTVELSDSYQFQIDDDILDKVLSLTPNQSLNALKREVAYDAWMEGACFIDDADVLPRGLNGHFENYVEVYLNTKYPTEGEKDDS